MIKNINVEAEKNIFISIHSDADFFLVYMINMRGYKR